MKIRTNQSPSLADGIIDIPPSELDGVGAILSRVGLGGAFDRIRTDYEPECLFRALILRELCNLSYERLSASLHRDLVFMGFCGFSLSGAKPDAATLVRFRDRLIEKKLWGKLLGKVNRVLEREGLKIERGHAVADATPVPSARRPRKVFVDDGEDGVTGPEYSDDPDASYAVKAGKAVYGYSLTAVTDGDGLVEGVSVSPANESETTAFPEKVLTGVASGRRVIYDKGADSKANREARKRARVKDGIMRRKPRGKEYAPWEKLRNSLLSKKRFVVERTFGTLKRTYGMARAKLVGLEKFATEAIAKAIAYNLRRAANRLPAA